MADLSGNRVEINTLLVPHCKKGDWVLLHGGYAIQTLSELDVQATWVLASDSHHEGAKP
jgi:hydrogenase maturation factor